MPPGGCKFYVAHTGQWVPSRGTLTSLLDLMRAVKRYYEAHNMPIPENLQEHVEEQICTSLPPGWCEDEHHAQNKWWSFPFTFQQVTTFTSTMVSWWRTNRLEPVETQEIKARADVCSRCEFNQDPDGCSSCNKPVLRQFTEDLLVGTRGPWDNALKSCKICGCLLSVKVRVPKGILLKHMPTEQLEKLPAHCWLKK